MGGLRGSWGIIYKREKVCGDVGVSLEEGGSSRENGGLFGGEGRFGGKKDWGRNGG